MLRLSKKYSVYGENIGSEISLKRMEFANVTKELGDRKKKAEISPATRELIGLTMLRPISTLMRQLIVYVHRLETPMTHYIVCAVQTLDDHAPRALFRCRKSATHGLMRNYEASNPLYLLLMRFPWRFQQFNGKIIACSSEIFMLQ